MTAIRSSNILNDYHFKDEARRQTNPIGIYQEGGMRRARSQVPRRIAGESYRNVYTVGGRNWAHELDGEAQIDMAILENRIKASTTTKAKDVIHGVHFEILDPITEE